MAFHQDSKEDTLILSYQIPTHMQTNVVSLLARGGFALLMFLTLQPIWDILCAVSPAYSHWPSYSAITWAKPASQCTSEGCPRPRWPRTEDVCQWQRHPVYFQGVPFPGTPGLSGQMSLPKGPSSCVGSVCGIPWASMGLSCK